MSKRYVKFPLMDVGLGAYARAWKSVLSARPEERIASNGFSHHPETAGYILREFRKGLDVRINRHDSRYGKGRKWDADWQVETMRAAQKLNTPRLFIHEREIPEWMRQRFSHRTHGPNDI